MTTQSESPAVVKFDMFYERGYPVEAKIKPKNGKLSSGQVKRLRRSKDEDSIFIMH